MAENDVLDRILSELAEMRSIMATKDDFANMATKDDITNMATKDDFANTATKDDISNMATKSDISNMATKGDIKYLEKELGEVKADVQSIRGSVARIEIDHGEKIGMLLDGHKFIVDKLRVIEDMVARHEEIIVTKLL